MSTVDDLRSLYRYQLLADDPVGMGGCGVVWKARDRLLDRLVAIKTILASFNGVGVSEKAERSFRTEAIAAARLSQHSLHVMPVYDLGRTGSTIYFVMKWLDGPPGPDVESMVGNSTIGEAVAVISDAARGVETAHSHGIVHGDIAPWNIMRDSKEKRFLVSDFGLLKIVETSLVSASGSLLRGGRLRFMPPYARQDISRLSYATDVYALAMTFWVLLTGKAALNHRTEDIPRVIRCKKLERDCPFEVNRLLDRFITDHAGSDSVSEFVEVLAKVPTR